ncbi:MAG: Gfo/Idh/MocA family oxidoreductase [Aquificae bacterium]|nr:Gfo/Idh/MocA family oxidoreductase [Aquificota bacterium]
MKVAIVGTGNMGSKYIKKFEIMGLDPILIDIDENQLSQYPDSLKKYTDLKEALEKEKIGYMFVATAPQHHIPIAIEGLKRGVNVMVEKPPALSPNQLEEAIELAHKNNTVLAVSEIELRASSIRNLSLPKGIHKVEGYRLNKGRGYINPLYDLAWHDLYILGYLFGQFKIKDVKDEGDKVSLEGETEVSDFFIQVAWSNPTVRREWIIQGDKTVRVDLHQDKIYTDDGKVLEGDGKDKLEMMINQFIQSPSFESSYRALNILREFEKINLKG